MYKSPIELLVTNIYDQIQKDQDEHIYQAVLQYVPNVDREELIRALQYDRNQYDKGYADGKADAMAEVVRCKDCKYWDEDRRCNGIKNGLVMEYTWDDDFCSYGERKDND